MTPFIIADSLFNCLGGLANADKARVFDFITTFRKGPDSPGISLERITRTRTSNLWSGRISEDLRAILHKDGDTWALLYADHHDPAYRWAERRDVGRHPVTGVLQIVDTQETVREVERVIHIQIAPPLFAAHDDDYLLSLGVPQVWLPTLRKLASGDDLLLIHDKLPRDVAERLLLLADGELVTPPAPLAPDRPVTDSPDLRQRFYVVEREADLRAALDAPFDRWISFLHPSQRALVTLDARGPVKVTGSAGTGKTIVALHRARHLAQQGRRVLLTSFVKTLCGNLDRAIKQLCNPEEQARITVTTVHAQALALAQRAEPGLQPASDRDIEAALTRLIPQYAPNFDAPFVLAEWNHVVVPQGLTTWDEYRAARRIGRGTAISLRDRKALWQVFSGARETLASRGRADFAAICARATELLASAQIVSPFDAVLVDEVQDLKAPELRLLKQLCAHNPGGLMLVGDAGQRIYPGGFSLSALGIEVRGRSHLLKINYRTTEQIRRLADRLLGTEGDDLDGASERRGARSLLHGPAPTLGAHKNAADELAAAVERVRTWLAAGFVPESIAVFTRTRRQLEPLTTALQAAGIVVRQLADDDDNLATAPGVRLGTMHRAKGLEFKAVLLLGCSASHIPSPKVLEALTDPQDRENAEASERRLLYVAMTRARDELHLSWSGKPSPFLAALQETRT